MASPVFMIASAAIILALGLIHLVYTFHGPRFNPRDPSLKAAMRRVSPVLTRATTMWKAWVGFNASFNASHSMGAILFGLIYGYLALSHPEILFRSHYLLGVGLTMLGGLAVLGRLYWFRIPFVGVCAATMSFVAAIAFSPA